MKTLKTFLLVLAIGFAFSIPVTTNFPEIQYYNSGKGKLLTAQIMKPAKFVVIGVEGGYEYYLQYVKFKLDYEKPAEEQNFKNKRISSSCNWLPWI